VQSPHKQISLEFSGGNFEFAYPHLADDATWNIIGNEMLTGKADIIEFCNKTAEYFTQVTTEFKTDNIIIDGDCIAINGTAEFFIEKENRSNHISSCDVYKFKDGKLQEITSYCISTDKK
jgi:ketosteroid isomerase-like protein